MFFVSRVVGFVSCFLMQGMPVHISDVLGVPVLVGQIPVKYYLKTVRIPSPTTADACVGDGRGGRSAVSPPRGAAGRGDAPGRGWLSCAAGVPGRGAAVSAGPQGSARGCGRAVRRGRDLAPQPRTCSGQDAAPPRRFLAEGRDHSISHRQGCETILGPDPDEPVYRALCPHAAHGFDKLGRPVRRFLYSTWP